MASKNKPSRLPKRTIPSHPIPIPCHRTTPPEPPPQKYARSKPYAHAAAGVGMLWEGQQARGRSRYRYRAALDITREERGVYCRAGRAIGSWWCLQVDGAVEEATWVRWVVVDMEDGRGVGYRCTFFFVKLPSPTPTPTAIPTPALPLAFSCVCTKYHTASRTAQHSLGIERHVTLFDRGPSMTIRHQ